MKILRQNTKEYLFIKPKDWELKVREIKTSRKIEELFFDPIIVSINDMDKFEEKQMMKRVSLQKAIGTIC